MHLRIVGGKKRRAPFGQMISACFYFVSSTPSMRCNSLFGLCQWCGQKTARSLCVNSNWDPPLASCSDYSRQGHPFPQALDLYELDTTWDKQWDKQWDKHNPRPERQLTKARRLQPDRGKTKSQPPVNLEDLRGIGTPGKPTQYHNNKNSNYETSSHWGPQKTSSYRRLASSRISASPALHRTLKTSEDWTPSMCCDSLVSFKPKRVTSCNVSECFIMFIHML